MHTEYMQEKLHYPQSNMFFFPLKSHACEGSFNHREYVLLEVYFLHVPACCNPYHGIVLQMRTRTTSMVTSFATPPGLL